MAASQSDATAPRPRPRPASGSTVSGSATGSVPDTGTLSQYTAAGARARPAAAKEPNGGARGGSKRRRKTGRGLAVVDPAQSQQMVTAAGNAIVTAARVGRLLGRSGWRIAKQLPGVTVVEQQAERLRRAAAQEMFRLLEMPQSVFGTATDDEQRAMMLVHDGAGDPAPLRSAMTELLERSTEANDAQSRDYLFGTIVSQLVPDEARILAALGGGDTFAVVDVVAKQVGRGATRTVLANASTLGLVAGLALPANIGTYLSRLHGYGLVHFGAADDSLASQYDAIGEDHRVKAARAEVDSGKQGSSKLIRKTVSLAPLGLEFWQACAPTRPGLTSRR